MFVEPDFRDTSTLIPNAQPTLMHHLCHDQPGGLNSLPIRPLSISVRAAALTPSPSGPLPIDGNSDEVVKLKKMVSALKYTVKLEKNKNWKKDKLLKQKN